MNSTSLIAATMVSTVGLVLLANRVQEIGERIPYVLLSVWGGSAAVAALIFSTRGVARHSSGSAPSGVSGSRLWADKMRLIAASLLPLVFVPLLEIRHSGYDPALWLMNGVLIVSLCSAPYFWFLARSVVGAVVFSICSLALPWHFSAWALFMVITRTEAAKESSTVDTSQTLHAFLAPEYRHFFYGLCALALLIYCPIMLWLGYRRFLTQQSAQLA